MPELDQDGQCDQHGLRRGQEDGSMDETQSQGKLCHGFGGFACMAIVTQQ